MGAAKMPELAVERYFENNNETARFAQKVAEPARPKPQLRYCPLCFDSYLDEEQLQRHVARSHGKQHIYLKVNDEVVRDLCWLTKPIRCCELVLLNIPEVQVVINATGLRQVVLRRRESGSLEEGLPPPGFEGTVSIDVIGGPRNVDFTIYAGRQPEFSADDLDAEFRGLHAALRKGQKVDLIAFHADWSRRGLNNLERRYLDGGVEYCHGCILDRQVGSNGRVRDRLELAMDLLLPFRTDIAATIRCLLSLRMNCFSGLRACVPSSPFFEASRFFCEGDQDSEPAYIPLDEREPLDIFVDSTSALFLSSLDAYCREDDERVLLQLNDLRNRSSPLDANDEVKFSLLEARFHRRRGDVQRAAATYTLLVHHPLFGREAALYRASTQR